MNFVVFVLMVFLFFWFINISLQFCCSWRNRLGPGVGSDQYILSSFGDIEN